MNNPGNGGRDAVQCRVSQIGIVKRTLPAGSTMLMTTPVRQPECSHAPLTQASTTIPLSSAREHRLSFDWPYVRLELKQLPGLILRSWLSSDRRPLFGSLIRRLPCSRTNVGHTMNAFKNAEHFGTGTCSDEKAAARTMGFNQFRMSRIDLEHKLSIRTWHGARHL